MAGQPTSRLSTDAEEPGLWAPIRRRAHAAGRGRAAGHGGTGRPGTASAHARAGKPRPGRIAPGRSNRGLSLPGPRAAARRRIFKLVQPDSKANPEC